MAGTSFRIEPEGLEDVLAAYTRVGSMHQRRAMFADIGEYLDMATRERFQLEMAPDGTPWEGLDPEYQARKKRQKNRILVLDAYLRDQMSYDAQPGSVEFGTARIYGATHQFGDDDRGIPARPFLGLSDDDEIHILNLAREHLESAIGPSA